MKLYIKTGVLPAGFRSGLGRFYTDIITASGEIVHRCVASSLLKSVEKAKKWCSKHPEFELELDKGDLFVGSALQVEDLSVTMEVVTFEDSSLPLSLSLDLPNAVFYSRVRRIKL